MMFDLNVFMYSYLSVHANIKSNEYNLTQLFHITHLMNIIACPVFIVGRKSYNKLKVSLQTYIYMYITYVV